MMMLSYGSSGGVKNTGRWPPKICHSCQRSKYASASVASQMVSADNAAIPAPVSGACLPPLSSDVSVNFIIKVLVSES